jgi:TPP-dependent pyruvate/acetoin dehydrogenase alpha subunit
MSGMSQELKALYRIALRIRLVEQKIASEYSQAAMRCPVHLSIGQEIVSAIVGLTQELNDTAVSTHRAHAHYLAKGGDLYRMVAEIYGKVTGCCKGRGGSMHLIDLSVGFLGSSAIVGNSIPIGVGSGFAHRLENTDSLSFIFLGDGATEEGSFYESVNFAAVRGLPIVFICENNLYSVYTDLGPRQPLGRNISEMVTALGVQAHRIDLSNPIAAYQQVNKLIIASRKTGKPLFIEFLTYRWLEHCGPNDDDGLGYRPIGELQNWLENDSLKKLKDMLESEYDFNSEEIEEMEREISKEIENIFQRVKADRFPTIQECMSDVYAE